MYKFILGDKVYNTLKVIVQIIMPAAATLYFSLGSIWGWPNVESVIGTVTAITTFLGVTLGISGHNYKKEAVPVSATPDGVLNVLRQDNGEVLYDFDANDTMADLRRRKSVVFKVNNKLDNEL